MSTIIFLENQGTIGYSVLRTVLLAVPGTIRGAWHR